MSNPTTLIENHAMLISKSKVLKEDKAMDIANLYDRDAERIDSIIEKYMGVNGLADEWEHSVNDTVDVSLRNFLSDEQLEELYKIITAKSSISTAEGLIDFLVNALSDDVDEIQSFEQAGLSSKGKGVAIKLNGRTFQLLIVGIV